MFMKTLINFIDGAKAPSELFRLIEDDVNNVDSSATVDLFCTDPTRISSRIDISLKNVDTYRYEELIKPFSELSHHIISNIHLHYDKDFSSKIIMTSCYNGLYSEDPCDRLASIGGMYSKAIILLYNFEINHAGGNVELDFIYSHSTSGYYDPFDETVDHAAHDKYPEIRNYIESYDFIQHNVIEDNTSKPEHGVGRVYNLTTIKLGAGYE